ncbi:MAG: hypothetical protein NPINA01_01270 [Nitrospinaceae bacterium]|nr:MAG: hypothetical protein NPINA01_01270 [Nitrospinaceae bacterium]
MQVTGSQNSSFLYFSPTSGRKASPSLAEPQVKIALSETPRSNRRDILFDSFKRSQGGINSLQATGPLALFRTQDAVKFLSVNVDSQRFPVADDLSKTPRFSELQIDRLGDLKNSLQTLQSRVSRLQNEDALNFRGAKSTKPDVIQVEAGKNSPVTDFSVRADRLAQEDVRVSDEQSTPLGSLGLSGSFFINGIKVTVQDSDSVFEIRNKINFGEDQNRNGILDGPEDLNGNNLLESYSVAATEFGPGVFVNEDLDGDGALDPAEDSNNNKRLDGGITETRAVASVQDNRLVFTSLTGSDTRIDLRDDDNVLLALGFFERDRKGNPILKERQFDSGNPPVNLNKNPESAQIEVDGETVTNPTNSFQNVAEDTTLTVKQISQRKAKISLLIDASQVVSQIQSLFEQFNAAAITLNTVLGQSAAFGQDQDIQKIREGLTGGPQEKTKELSQRNDNLEATLGSRENQKLLGIDVKNTGKNRVQDESILSAVRSVKSGENPSFNGAGGNRVQRLTAIGIKTQEDDTFVVDVKKLDRALNINSEEVLDLLNNPENGILPLLDKQLNRILDSGLGDIDLKRQEISLRASNPDPARGKLRQFEESSNLKRTLQNLIAVA